MLASKLPNSGLTAILHIESRVRHFRTKYGAIEVILGRSGFDWDENRKMVQCEKQQYNSHCKDNPDARGLYGISFPYYETLAAIYSKDIATGGAEGIGEAVSNMEKEIALGDSHNEVEEDRMSMDTPKQSLDSRNSMDSTSSSSKRRKKAKDNSKGNEPSLSSDPFLDMVGGLRGDLNKASQHFGKMAEAMEWEAKVQAEATQNDPVQMLQKAVA